MRYQQRMARLVERKIQQTREKLAVLGARDEDDYGLVLPPEGFVPELPVRDENGSLSCRSGMKTVRLPGHMRGGRTSGT